MARIDQALAALQDHARFSLPGTIPDDLGPHAAPDAKTWIELGRFPLPKIGESLPLSKILHTRPCDGASARPRWHPDRARPAFGRHERYPKRALHVANQTVCLVPHVPELLDKAKLVAQALRLNLAVTCRTLQSQIWSLQRLGRWGPEIGARTCFRWLLLGLLSPQFWGERRII
jgi:hypothetical protein